MENCNVSSYDELAEALFAYDWRDGREALRVQNRDLSAAPSQMHLPLLTGAAAPFVAPSREIAGTFFPGATESISLGPMPGHGARMDNTIRSRGPAGRTGASLMPRSDSQNLSRSAGSQLGAPMEPRMSTTYIGAPKDAAANMLQTLQSKLSCMQEQVRNLPRTGYASRPRQTPVVEMKSDNVLDDDFLALVCCNVSSQYNPRKRKAGKL